MSQKVPIPVKICHTPFGWYVFDMNENPLLGPFNTREDAVEMIKGYHFSQRNNHIEDIN